MGNSLSSRRSPFKRLRAPRQARVFMTGPWETGKTSILYHIAPPDDKRGPQVKTEIPTIGLNLESVETPEMIITATDVGGATKLQPLVHGLVRRNADGAIYVLDARTGRDENGWWQETIEEFEHNVLEIEQTAGGPVLVLVNFLDHERALPFEEIERQIREVVVKHDREKQPLSVRPINAKTGEGVWESLNWFIEELNVSMNFTPQMQEVSKR